MGTLFSSADTRTRLGLIYSTIPNIWLRALQIFAAPSHSICTHLLVPSMGLIQEMLQPEDNGIYMNRVIPEGT